VSSAALQTDGRYEVIVEGFRGVSSSKIQSTLLKRCPAPRSPCVANVPKRRLTYARKWSSTTSMRCCLAATAIDGVAFVSPWFQTTTTNSGSIGAIQGNLTGTCAGSGPICGATPMFDQGITGGGQIIAIGDSGTTVNAAWFATLDKGDGPHAEVTFSDNPPPVLPNIGTLHPDNKIIAYCCSRAARSTTTTPPAMARTRPAPWLATRQALSARRPICRPRRCCRTMIWPTAWRRTRSC